MRASYPIWDGGLFYGSPGCRVDTADYRLAALWFDVMICGSVLLLDIA